MREETTRYKQLAARAAVEKLESGMVVGLGHGSTVAFAVERLATRLQTGKLQNIVAVPSSSQTAQMIQQKGIPLTTLEEHLAIDVTIDGADEIDPQLNLIKGQGGALLHEKIIAQASRYEIIVVHNAKLSSVLGTQAPVPVEVIPFGWRTHLSFLTSLGARVTARKNKSDDASLSLFQTDEGNYILDCDFGPISDSFQLSTTLSSRAGVVAHGLFLGLTTEVIVAGPEGIQHLKVKAAP